MKLKSSLLLSLFIVIVMVASLSGMQRNAQVSNRQVVRVGNRQVIRVGQDINEAIKIMSQAGIKEGLGLAIVASEKTDRLTGWPVINGYLVATYSTINNRIVSLSLYLKDPRPLSERTRDLIFKVNSYLPATGEILMIVPNKAMKRQK